ncbi:MAG: PEP-CTERM sorting domain-containing protein [Planctomycetota bacterium]
MRNAPVALIAASFAGPAMAVDIPLASVMDPAGTISESLLTGETFVISNGGGAVANGLAGDDDSNPAFGSPINLFPNEANFNVGSISVDAGAVSPTGFSTAPITGLDLSDLWAPDPNRTVGTPGVDAIVLSDISDWAIGLWLGASPGDITFGPLDASDTASFDDGLLNSIDLIVDASFSANTFVGLLTFNGTFSIIGDELSFQINDSEQTFFGDSFLTVDLTGDVAAVDTFVIPEPATAGLLSLGGFAVLRRRRA